MKIWLIIGMVVMGCGSAEVRGALPVTKIAAGCQADQSYFLTAGGRLWAMGGQPVFSQNGLDLPVGIFPHQRPQQILVTNVTVVAGGDFFNYMVTVDGTVWGSGSAPGVGEITNFSAGPVAPLPISEVTDVSAGQLHGLFLRADGSLWGVGNSESGQLGDGIIYSGAPGGPYLPEQIVAGNVKAIAAGGWHSLFLKTDGSLWAMGSDNYGQLGDGRPGFAQYGSAGESFYTNQPEQIVPGEVVAIAAGTDHSLFLKDDGSLWSMGWNSYGQLGIGNFTGTNVPMPVAASNVVAIAAGGYHSLFLKSDGSLWGMGRNDEGQLGGAPFSSYPPPADGVNVPEMIVGSNVVAIAAGQYHSLFLKSDGSLWAMGQNMEDQLGDGFDDTETRLHGTDVPEQVYPVPAPQLVEQVSDGTDLQFTANCGFGGTFYLLMSTNAALPACQWTPVWTNEIDYRAQSQFSLTLSNAIPMGGGQQFFRLQAE